MFAAFAAGALFLATGVVGFDVRHTHVLRDGRRAEGPIWSQIMLGLGLLLLGGFWSRRLDEPEWTTTRIAPSRMLKNAGRAAAPAPGRG